MSEALAGHADKQGAEGPIVVLDGLKLLSVRNGGDDTKPRLNDTFHVIARWLFRRGKADCRARG